MFPVGRRNPMPPPPYARFSRPMGGRPPSKSSAAIPNLISRFRNPEGQFDFDKVTHTAVQLNKLYGEVSPMIAMFRNKLR